MLDDELRNESAEQGTGEENKEENTADSQWQAQDSGSSVSEQGAQENSVEVSSDGPKSETQSAPHNSQESKSAAGGYTAATQEPVKSKKTLYIGIAAVLAVVAIIAIFSMTQGNNGSTVAEEPTTTIATQAPTTAAADVTTVAPVQSTEQATSEENSDLVNISPAPSVSSIQSSIDNSNLPIVATLADQTVTQADFKYFLNYYKTGMLAETGIEQGSPDEAEFWNQMISEDTRVIDYAKLNAISELENLKVCMAVAAEKNVVLDEEDLENINMNFQSQIDGVGGEEEFLNILENHFGVSFDDYRSLYSEFVLQDKLVYNELEQIVVTDAEVQAYYEEHLQEYLEKGIDKKEAMKMVARDRGVPKREIYNQINVG